MADQLNDPYRAYPYKVKVSGIDDSQFHFTQCGPISATHEPITLSYGVTDSRVLVDWLMRAAEGKVERKNVSILILSSDSSSTKEHWELVAAWPLEWQGSDMDAASGGLVIAQLSLVYGELNRKD